MIVQLRALDGSLVEFDDSKIIGKGEMKDVYFSPDKSYVVAFYRNKELNKDQLLDRLETIVGKYYKSIFSNRGGKYWEKLFCWPTKVVMYNDQVGLVSPTYRSCFFFKYGSENNDSGGIAGKEKEGKWFASIRNRSFLDPRERGSWENYMTACFKMAQAVKRLNAAGLAHSDLSYKNVLVDPPNCDICIIDLDGLVVTGKFNPEVMGTADFIAPEVIVTQHLSLDDKGRILPSIETDCHALATLIYMYLLNRHPLRGGKIYSLDPDEDEELVMGKKALFIEHPTDRTNAVNVNDLHPLERIAGDPAKTPYTVCGPFLKTLFDRAFIDGLHKPKLRPRAEEWATALSKTLEMLAPCSNITCSHRWFVYEPGLKKCPFCDYPITSELPVLRFYRKLEGNNYSLTRTQLVAFEGKKIYKWMVTSERIPIEFATEEDKKVVVTVLYENGIWSLLNAGAIEIQDAGNFEKIEPGRSMRLYHGCQIRFGAQKEELVFVQLDSTKPLKVTLQGDDPNQSESSIPSENKFNRLNAAIAQIKRDKPQFYKQYAFLFDRDEIIFPDGIINKEYSFPIGDTFPDNCPMQFIGLESFGLYYDRISKKISGFPSQIGDLSIIISVKLPFAGIKVSKNAKLTINVQDASLNAMPAEEGHELAQMPKAHKNQQYRANFNDIFKDIEIENVLGHEDLGLSYNNRTKILSGVPSQIGEFQLKIRYRSKGIGSSKLLLLSKTVALKIDNPVEIRWQSIPTQLSVKFYKPDMFSSAKEVYVNDSLTSVRKLYGVSCRGRLHANNGLPRNADFAVGNSCGWVALALADGTDKSEFSREGARVASQTAVLEITKQVEKMGHALDEVVKQAANPNNISGRTSRVAFQKIILEAYKKALNEIKIHANFANMSYSAMSTNLSVVILKRFDFGWFVASSCVGQCGVAICNGDFEMEPMGFSDSGDYIFRNGTIDNPHCTDDDELKRRIDIKICDSLVMLMFMNNAMMNGVFGSLVNLRNSESWSSWLAELATEVNIKGGDDDSILRQMQEYVCRIPDRQNGDKTLIVLR